MQKAARITAKSRPHLVRGVRCGSSFAVWYSREYSDQFITNIAFLPIPLRFQHSNNKTFQHSNNRPTVYMGLDWLAVELVNGTQATYKLSSPECAELLGADTCASCDDSLPGLFITGTASLP